MGDQRLAGHLAQPARLPVQDQSCRSPSRLRRCRRSRGKASGSPSAQPEPGRRSLRTRAEQEFASCLKGYNFDEPVATGRNWPISVTVRQVESRGSDSVVLCDLEIGKSTVQSAALM